MQEVLDASVAGWVVTAALANVPWCGFNCPPEDILKSDSLVPVTLTALGNRVFADVMSCDEIPRVGPSSDWTSVLKRREIQVRMRLRIPVEGHC